MVDFCATLDSLYRTSQNQMKINDVYTSNYLKSSDVTETPTSYTIKDATVEQIGQNKDEKIVIYFVGHTKGFVVNKTNAKTISKVLGSDDTDDWAGKAIKLYLAEVQFKGELVEAIRVSLKPGKAESLSIQRKNWSSLQT